MALFGKVLKSVVTGDSGKNKNDVKVAKIELKKAKLEQQAEESQKIKEEITNIVKYVGTNIDEIEIQIFNLESETKNLVDAYQTSDKRTQRKLLVTIDEKLPYLYLLKSFFSSLSKAASGINMPDNERVFVVKFAPYFYGNDVLQEQKKEDESIVGQFKEMGAELASEFVSTKKAFSFTDFMGEYGTTHKIAMPDVQTNIKMFKKTYTQMVLAQRENVSESNNSEDARSVRCPNCNARLLEGQKFCPECGEKIITTKLFCTECGNRLEPGVKFCPYCGNRM